MSHHKKRNRDLSEENLRKRFTPEEIAVLEKFFKDRENSSQRTLNHIHRNRDNRLRRSRSHHKRSQRSQRSLSHYSRSRDSCNRRSCSTVDDVVVEIIDIVATVIAVLVLTTAGVRIIDVMMKN